MPQGIGYPGFRRGGFRQGRFRNLRQPVITNPAFDPIANADPGFSIDSVASPQPIAQLGRFGDSEIAHVSPGETLVPRSVAAQPAVQQGLSRGFRRAGMNPERFVVRSGQNSINPRTGAREFFSPGTEGEGKFGREQDAFSGGNPGVPEGGRDGGSGFGGGGFGDGAGRGFRGNRGATATPDPTAGLTPDFFTQDAARGRFRTSPGFEFRRDQAIDAVDRSAARFGSLFSGNQATAIAELGDNLASAEYADYYNRLAGLAGIGQSSAAQTGALTAQTTANQGSAIIAGGDAAASGAVGVNNAIQGGITNAMFQQFLTQQGAG